MKDKVIANLKELGFTEYEAKVYLTLVEKSPLSGYAISLNSGIPRSKVYQVLGAMAARGDLSVSQEETPRYAALSPDEMIQMRRKQSEQRLKNVEESLKSFTHSQGTGDSIWNLSGRESVFHRVRTMIQSAEQRILLEVWDADIPELRDDLHAAQARGIQVTLVAYGPVELGFGQVYHHYNPERITQEYGGRWLVASVDDRVVVAGMVSLGSRSRAAWTTHPGLVMPITEVIIHDIYILEILKRLGPELEKEFGKNLSQLHERFRLPANGKKYSFLFDSVQESDS